ncbi:MAG TPA: DNA topoisomerase III, partial [Paludibacter sp.]|nr:DNA topoisomerase III [Paludibacter sp.]
GRWEKKLRQVEKGEYQAKDFLDELKAMVTEIVFNVKSDNRRPGEAALQAKPILEGTVCPLCGKGTLLKGKTAYGCSEWKSGCTYRLPF